MIGDKYFLQANPHEQNFAGEGLFMAPDTFDDQYQRYTLRSWWVFLQAHKDKPYKIRIQLYERALNHIPNCYKLWFNYLKESLQYLKREKSFLTNRFEHINILFERSLVYMHKMPNIWLLYCDFLHSQGLVSRTRQAYDRALANLPVTQHQRIWKKYCDWVTQCDSVKTAIHVFERYLKIDPDAKEEYLDYLVSKANWDKASIVLVDILNDEGYNSPSGKSKYEFLSQLCDIISMHPHDIKSIDCAPIMFYGIKKYTDEVGSMWIRLADYHIKLGLWEKARDVFEEALRTVQAVRDFSQIFNAYVKFEESLVTMLQLDEEDQFNDDLDDTELAKKLDKILGIKGQLIDQDQDTALNNEISLKFHRLENLLDRRQLLLNSCLLRQNKYNITEWLNRANLLKNDDRMILKTFKDAIEQVDPQKAEIGKLSDVWVEYAKFYRQKGDWKTANRIFEQGSQVNYKNVDEYVNIWCQWVECLLEDGYASDAIVIIKQALFRKKHKDTEKNISDSVGYSLELWQLYLDLERNFGTFQTLRSAYHRMLELKVITPFLIMIYGQLLEENAYYEESFKVFESGIGLFTWPSLYELWVLYITKFIARYRGTKVERVRNLFETVLEQVPVEKCKIFYLMYGDFEEQFGLLNHAIEIYDRMVFNVEYQDKMEAYNIYIAKVGTYLGVTKTRAVFESAIENLKENEVIQMGMRLAQLERKFGEIDRARAIYMHIAQFNDPRYDDFELWKTWENFELYHGNEDTYKDLKRVSKSVISKFNLLPPDPQKIKERVDKGQI